MARFRRVTFSGMQLALSTIHQYHSDIEQSLHTFFSEENPHFSSRFAGYTLNEVQTEREKAIEEHERKSVLSLLASLEAAFRIDYLHRCQKKLRDPLSTAFREIYKEFGQRVSLEDDILAGWKDHGGVSPGPLADLKGAFKYRHWLAHGRYWVPKVGRQYDYVGIYTLAQSIYNYLPFETPEI